jgi:restriction endonuclease S subunit
MKTYKLGEVCELSKGKTITRATTREGQVPVIGGGLGPTYFHDVDNRKPPVITISASGANAGFVNYWDIPIWASDCTTIVEKSGSPALIGYIYKFLQSKQGFINSELRRGSAQPHVYPTDIANLEIRLPSIEKQHKIVEKLDVAFADIYNAIQSISLEIEGIPHLFKQMLKTEISKLEVEEVSILSDLTELITKGTTPTSVGFKFSQSGINFLKVESLDESGRFLQDKFAFIDQACHEALKRSQLRKDDVLVSIAGALGRTGLVSDEICPANLNQALAIVRLGIDSTISPKYLFSLFQAGYFNEDLLKMGAGAAQQNLSLAQIGSLKVPVLNKENQDKFIEYLFKARNEVDLLKSNLRLKLKLYEDLKNSILDTFMFSKIEEVA